MAVEVTVDPEVAKKVDRNGDGHISQEEMEMNLEFKRKELEDADARRDAMRKMTWFALMGMLYTNVFWYLFVHMISSHFLYYNVDNVIHRATF